jgi:hypothetical protein
MKLATEAGFTSATRPCPVIPWTCMLGGVPLAGISLDSISSGISASSGCTGFMGQVEISGVHAGDSTIWATKRLPEMSNAGPQRIVELRARKYAGGREPHFARGGELCARNASIKLAPVSSTKRFTRTPRTAGN